jgi:hypothetical protein
MVYQLSRRFSEEGHMMPNLGGGTQSLDAIWSAEAPFFPYC